MDNNENSKELIALVDGIAPQVRHLKKLLSKGANINYQDVKTGQTPLMAAVKGQHDRIVEYLLKQGADPFVQDHENRIASELISQHNTIYPILKDFELFFAVLNNDLITTETVIAEGALINFRGVRGYTSLMVAAEQNHPEMAELLILHGADPTLTLANGQTAINLTADSSVVNLLKEAQNWGKEIKSTLKKYPYRFFTV